MTDTNFAPDIDDEDDLPNPFPRNPDYRRSDAWPAVRSHGDEAECVRDASDDIVTTGGGE